MKKMAELQLSIVSDPKNRKAIENQVTNNSCTFIPTEVLSFSVCNLLTLCASSERRAYGSALQIGVKNQLLLSCFVCIMMWNGLTLNTDLI